MKQIDDIFFAFSGSKLICRGSLAQVTQALKSHLDDADVEPAIPLRRIAVYNERTGKPVDLDADQMPAFPPTTATAAGPEATPTPKKRGRPRLGVETKEVALLPRHWEYLQQTGKSHSAALRSMVETAWRNDASTRKIRAAMEAAHAFMWDLAGDLPGYEEASRCFYRGDFIGLYDICANWPGDISRQVQRMVEVYRATKSEFDQ